MAHSENEAHESHVGLIWKVFWFLSFVTIVEVVLGIYKPESLHLKNFLGTSLLNWIFLILTLVKAYGIAWYFMHLKYEQKWFRRAIVWTCIFLIVYLTTLVLIEGSYIHDIMSPYMRWN